MICNNFLTFYLRGIGLSQYQLVDFQQLVAIHSRLQGHFPSNIRRAAQVVVSSRLGIGGLVLTPVVSCKVLLVVLYFPGLKIRIVSYILVLRRFLGCIFLHCGLSTSCCGVSLLLLPLVIPEPH